MSNEQKWAERVAAWRASGLTSTEFCAGKDFTPGGLRHWSHLLKKRGAAVRPRAITTPETVRIARVERAAVAPMATALVVELGDVRVRVPAGFDAATVDVVVGALCRQARGAAR